MNGYTREELIGQPIDLLNASKSEPERRAAYLQSVREAGILRQETVHRRKDGSLIHIQIHTSIVNLNGRELILGIDRDITELKQAEAALRESEARYRIVTELISDYAYSYRVEPDGTLAHEWLTEDSFTRITGYTREELDARSTVVALYHPEDQATVLRDLDSTLQGHSSSGDYRILTKDGQVRWLHIQRRPVWDSAQNRVTRLYGVAQDISERKLADIRLRESEERFRATFEQAAVGIAHTDMQGSYLRVNQKFCNIVGYTREEMLARTWMEMSHPEDVLIDTSQAEQLVAGNLHTYSMEKRYIRKDGSLVWVNLTVSLVRTPQGEPDYFIAVIEDISERKYMEDELLQTHLQLEATYDTFYRLIQQIPIGIQIFDAQGFCVEVNQAHLDIFGVGNREQLVGHFNIFEDTAAERLGTQDGARRALVGETVSLGDLTFDFAQADPRYTATAGKRVINVSFFPIFDRDGAIRRIVALNQDLTERKRAEAQQIELAAERARMKVVERFAHDASHDLRTPLSIMQTSAYLLSKTNEPEKRQRHLDNLEAQIAHITRVLEDFLDLSRLDQITTALHLEPCNLNLLLYGLRDEQQPLAAQKRHDIRLNLADHLPPVNGDETELWRAFRHLLINALNYTPDGGHISIVTCQQDSSAVVEVRDNGIGMSASQLPYIFERFYRADEARGTNTGGAGLGLTIAKKIIEAHKGKIEVESAPGEGSVFRVYLPIYA
jgi:PAS domain S-box-containing protein